MHICISMMERIVEIAADRKSIFAMLQNIININLRNGALFEMPYRKMSVRKQS